MSFGPVYIAFFNRFSVVQLDQLLDMTCQKLRNLANHPKNGRFLDKPKLIEHH